MKRKRKGHYHKGKYISLKSGCEYSFRSGWEENYMKYLDQHPDIVDWEYETFSIPYISNKRTGKIRKYFPDFKVKYASGIVEVVEIKPSKKLLHAIVKKKIDAAIRWCAENQIAFRIITENELKELHIL